MASRAPSPSLFASRSPAVTSPNATPSAAPSGALASVSPTPPVPLYIPSASLGPTPAAASGVPSYIKSASLIPSPPAAPSEGGNFGNGPNNNLPPLTSGAVVASGSSDLGTGGIAGLILAGIFILGAVIGVFIFRRLKLRPSSDFKRRITEGHEWQQPTAAGGNGTAGIGNPNYPQDTSDPVYGYYAGPGFADRRLYPPQHYPGSSETIQTYYE
ncbi:hypothetical protein SeLEV6574_g01072 [Synchytrium endobioticum]|uniref:Uncharacterized protein n=1 Tax=Synchytrium endobioticum TaxID=286115 RepID=A0A507DEX6_9FUNG|nr:hypothetical protein SeLEV6574_g01072 [Synchytrium endobioticum]